MPSIAVLIEAFANSTLAHEQQHLAQARLDEARRAGLDPDVIRNLSAEVACLRLRADNLHAAAEALLPGPDARPLSECTAETLVQ